MFKVQFASRIVIDQCTSCNIEENFHYFLLLKITIDPFGRRSCKEGHIFLFKLTKSIAVSVIVDILFKSEKY